MAALTSSNVAAPQAPAEYPDVQSSQFRARILAVVYNPTIYSTEFEVNDFTTNTWVYRFTLGPWEKNANLSFDDATGYRCPSSPRSHD